MENHFQINKAVFFFLILPIALFFASCSQSAPEVASTDYSVIFDYNDEKTLPQARLSVFALSASDVRRYQKIKITNFETGYTWETDVIDILEANEQQWAGCTNLKAPENEVLPCGQYELTYYNADEKECTVVLDVQYDLAFYNVVLSALSDVMTKKNGIEKIAIYDKEHILIYFGERTQELKSTRDIWIKYRDAGFYQIIWYSRDGTVICIEPEKLVVPENENE